MCERRGVTVFRSFAVIKHYTVTVIAYRILNVAMMTCLGPYSIRVSEDGFYKQNLKSGSCSGNKGSAPNVACPQASLRIHFVSPCCGIHLSRLSPKGMCGSRVHHETSKGLVGMGMDMRVATPLGCTG